MFLNFYTFYRPNICETTHVCVHVICQNRPLLAVKRIYNTDNWYSENLVCLQYIWHFINNFSVLSVCWWKGGGPVWCSPGHRGQVEGSHPYAGPSGALHDLHLHRPLCGRAGCRTSEGLCCRLCFWSSSKSRFDLWQNTHLYTSVPFEASRHCRPDVHIFLLFLPDAHVEPHKKQLHVTLAYHFHASHLPVLEKLAKNVDVCSGCDWLAVLYSRDIRFANHEVTLLVFTSNLVWSTAPLSDSYRHHPPCRRCRSCTHTYLRMMMSWSWCLEILSSCRPWSRAPSARGGCTAPRWPQGCRACCLRTTSTEQMSPTPGSSTGKAQKLGMLPINSQPLPGPSTHQMTITSSESGKVLSESVFLSLAIRSYSILNCASPSNSGGSVGGLLFDGKLSDSLLDSLMDASSPAGLCPPMQVWLSVAHARQRIPVLCLHNTNYKETEMIVLTCLCQVMRAACQPSLSKMRLFVCRHGERMDVVFGKHWVTQCFDSKG